MPLISKKLILLILLTFLIIITPACTPITFENRSQFRNQVLKTAKEKHFIPKRFQTPFFQLTTFSQITQPNQNPLLIIYLEGDGQSYDAKYQLSTDPTPYQPLGLQLALTDPRPNVIYIARPGQYPLSSAIACDPKYWSTHRFSQEVIDAINEVIDHFKNQINCPNTRVQLIGFSGGGGLAVLSAAHRHDVNSIITVSGDLDIDAMMTYHKTPALIGSLNPIDFACTLNHIPQYHFVGKKDRIVPPKIAKGYLIASGQHKPYSHTHPVQIQFIDAGHHQGWLEKWPELILYFS